MLIQSPVVTASAVQSLRDEETIKVNSPPAGENSGTLPGVTLKDASGEPYCTTLRRVGVKAFTGLLSMTSQVRIDMLGFSSTLSRKLAVVSISSPAGGMNVSPSIPLPGITVTHDSELVTVHA